MDVCYQVAYPLAEFRLDFCDGPNLHKHFKIMVGVTLDSNKMS